MSWSLKLGRVQGIDIKVHLTFVLILLWAAYTWSGTTGAGLQGALFGVVATVLLFVCVLLHELGHSLMALRFDIRVRDITLLPIGGLAQMETIPEKPGQELAIAIVGPLVNIAIAIVLLLFAAVLRMQALITLPELVASLGRANWPGLLAFLTMANLSLALFNLIPAFPMDGGRMLRALLAMHMDYGRATAIAVAVGQGFAILLGLWGFTGGGPGLVLIAIFVWLGAEQEGRLVEVRNVLRGMRVRQAMTQRPYSLRTDDLLATAVELTLSTSQADFPVLDERGVLVGLLTESDLIKALRDHSLATPAAEVMRREFPTASPEQPLFEAQMAMAEARARAMPVVTPDRLLVGLITDSDISEAYRLLSVSQRAARAAG